MEFFQKKAKVTPGIIAELHTFGSRVNFNPHVHMRVSIGGLTKKGEWKQYDFLPFAMPQEVMADGCVEIISEGINGQGK